jgi:hypothetical protein
LHFFLEEQSLRFIFLSLISSIKWSLF